MLNRPTVSCLAAALLGLGALNTAVADPLHVQGDIGILAAGDLYVVDLANPDGNGDAPTTMIAGIGNATDVVVSDCKAFVSSAATQTVTVVDLEALSTDAGPGAGLLATLCDDDGTAGSDDACVATFDSRTGDLFIPCIDADGNRFNAVLGSQRGNSSNWELRQLRDGYGDDDDDDDDNDDR